MTLPLYKSSSACIKCGLDPSTLYSIKYNPLSEYIPAKDAVLVDEKWISGPFILRTCIRCQYRWAEVPLDEA